MSAQVTNRTFPLSVVAVELPAADDRSSAKCCQADLRIARASVIGPNTKSFTCFHALLKVAAGLGSKTGAG